MIDSRPLTLTLPRWERGHVVDVSRLVVASFGLFGVATFAARTQPSMIDGGRERPFDPGALGTARPTRGQSMIGGTEKRR
jgi:hypothetical protein